MQILIVGDEMQIFCWIGCNFFISYSSIQKQSKMQAFCSDKWNEMPKHKLSREPRKFCSDYYQWLDLVIRFWLDLFGRIRYSIINIITVSMLKGSKSYMITCRVTCNVIFTPCGHDNKSIKIFLCEFSINVSRN